MCCEKTWVYINSVSSFLVVRHINCQVQVQPCPNSPLVLNQKVWSSLQIPKPQFFGLRLTQYSQRPPPPPTTTIHPITFKHMKEWFSIKVQIEKIASRKHSACILEHSACILEHSTWVWNILHVFWNILQLRLLCFCYGRNEPKCPLSITCLMMWLREGL